MNVLLWAIAVTAALVGGWFLYSVARRVARLQPQVRVASRKARQQKASRNVEGLDAEALLFRAQRGDAAAQMRVGLMFATGNGLPHDDAKAFGWFERAATSDFVEAQYYLGLAYEHGRGVGEDYAKARCWYEKAALNGSATAQCNLGMLHLRGVAEEEDWVSAVYWFLKSATQHNPEALSNLEWVVRHEDSAPANSTAILDRYRERAQRGDPDASFLIGWCYENGFAGPERPADATRWYERAQNMGHLYAYGPLSRLKSSPTVSANPRES